MMDLISEDEWRRQAELVKPMMYPEGENEAINEYFNEQFLDKSLYYDSTVAADYYLNLFIWKNTFMPIKCILLGMLLLSIFNQEVSNKTDQIMKPMKVSIRKQSIAKYVTTILIAVGFAFYDIGVYIGFLQLTIGFHNLNVVFDTQLLNNIDSFVTPIYSYQQIMITCSLLYIVSTVFIASFIALLSSITKHSYTALILYLIAITAMISIPYGYAAIIGTEMPYKLFLPLHMMCTDTVFKTLLSNYLVTIFNQNYFVIFDQVVFAPIIIGGVVLLISDVFFVILIEYQSKREIKNA